MKKNLKMIIATSAMLLATGCAPVYQQPATQTTAARTTVAAPAPAPARTVNASQKDTISVQVDVKKSVSNIRPANRLDKDYQINFGMNKIEIIGPVFQKENKGCSEVELFKFANETYADKRVDNIIHVRMEEIERVASIRPSPSSQPLTVKASVCRASALAITYVSVPLSDVPNLFPKFAEVKGETRDVPDKSEIETSVIKGSTLPAVYSEVNRKTGLEIR